ncbi:hypothetical protein [Granulicella arctica]|uniref:hypothetical protein n=1 Tax=Granulicella arctica TaxID=940613 RepID=UPI0021E0A7B7|nr:hypothetical protein [Granulicella arctica]
MGLSRVRSTACTNAEAAAPAARQQRIIVINIPWYLCRVVTFRARSPHRTKAVLSAMPPLLLELWREQHPKGHEQKQLDFSSKKPAAKLVPLFRDEKESSG